MRAMSQYRDDAYCAEHGRKVQDFLEIGNIWIPVCDDCVEELQQIVTHYKKNISNKE